MSAVRVRGRLVLDGKEEDVTAEGEGILSQHILNVGAQILTQRLKQQGQGNKKTEKSADLLTDTVQEHEEEEEGEDMED